MKPPRTRTLISSMSVAIIYVARDLRGRVRLASKTCRESDIPSVALCPEMLHAHEGLPSTTFPMKAQRGVARLSSRLQRALRPMCGTLGLSCPPRGVDSELCGCNAGRAPIGDSG